MKFKQIFTKLLLFSLYFGSTSIWAASCDIAKSATLMSTTYSGEKCVCAITGTSDVIISNSYDIKTGTMKGSIISADARAQICKDANDTTCTESTLNTIILGTYFFKAETSTYPDTYFNCIWMPEGMGVNDGFQLLTNHTPPSTSPKSADTFTWLIPAFTFLVLGIFGAWRRKKEANF